MKKNIHLFLVFCLLFNGFAPKPNIVTAEYDLLSTLVENQPFLQYYSTLSTLPVKIVYTLFETEASGRNSVPADQSSKRRAAPSDEFLLTDTAGKFSSRSSFTRHKVEGGFGPLPCHGLSVDRRVFALPAAPIMPRDAMGVLSLFLVLLLMVIRPRSSIDDSIIAIVKYITTKDPIRKTPGWVFPLEGTLP
jgi:hypothetical protein